MLVLPALMDRRLLEEEARRLAAHLAAARKHSARRAIYLFGYSCGAYVALRALELLPAGVEVEAAGLLAPAFRPGRDLGPALAHVRGRIVCVSSLADCLILGAGTLVFGTADRAHAPSAGMVGLRHSSARDGRVVQVRWHPAMAALGWFGSHFTAAAPGLIANRVALAMGIACPQTGIL
jgi:alpha-beta hydrolase superfamily lysophospholipase